MKLKIFVVVFAIVVAWFAGHHFYHAGHLLGTSRDGASTLGERIEAGEQVLNDSYALASGARVEVAGINGPVEIMTTDNSVAEVHVENNVSDARDLEYHRIIVEHDTDRLVVRAENRSGGGWGFLRWLTGRGGESATQKVSLKVPRQVNVAARGINGAVSIGEVEGAVRISGVNGEVAVARASGRADFSGVNGNVSVAMTQLGDDGMRVSGINGNIELKLANDVNADLRVGGLSGRVDNDLKNVTVEDDNNDHRSKFNARIGTGGAQIKISGIHGDVHLAYI